MVKLIVTDLDGTLLNDSKNIPEKNIIALKEAVKNGIHISVATGRNFYSAKKYIEELDLDVPVIFQNGSFIYEWKKNIILYQTPLKSEIAKIVIKFARKEDLFYILYKDFLSQKDMYIDKPYFGAFKGYMEHNNWRLNFVSDVLKYIIEDVAEIALVGDENKILSVISQLKNESELSIVKNNRIEDEVFYEFFGAGTGKENAMNFLLNHFDVSHSETMYIGDNYNDIELLKIVGYPVVMANAPEEVKIFGKYITSSNNEGGVGDAVRRIVLGE